jgi:hypothetical protein
VSPNDSLQHDLFQIYHTCGLEVTYVGEDGKTRRYWPKRYLQALQRAVEQNDIIGFVERLVSRDDAARGFGYLAEANRLDLTVEWLVMDEKRAYHHLFTEDAVISATARLMEASEEWQILGQLGKLKNERDSLDSKIESLQQRLAELENAKQLLPAVNAQTAG